MGAKDDNEIKKLTNILKECEPSHRVRRKSHHKMNQRLNAMKGVWTNRPASARPASAQSNLSGSRNDLEDVTAAWQQTFWSQKNLDTATKSSLATTSNKESTPVTERDENASLDEL